MPQTLAEKVWERHVVHRADGEPDLLYVDLHLVHEVTSAAGVRRAAAARPARPPPRPDRRHDGSQRADHARARHRPDQRAADRGAGHERAEFGVTLLPMGSPGQGIVHVIGPEQGYTQPGLVDRVRRLAHVHARRVRRARVRHRHVSEVEHVLATQTLPQNKPGTMAVTVEGELPAGVAREGRDPRRSSTASAPSGGVGHVIEYRGSAIRALSMEGRMTVCNMSIEAGARAGMIAPDDTTFAYVEGRPHAPQGADWERALEDWRTLPTDDGAAFDKEVALDAAELQPVRELGHEPRAVASRSTTPCPTPTLRRRRQARGGRPRARVHGSRARHADPRDPPRHDLHRLVHELADRGPARRGEVVGGRKVAAGLRALVVPGSFAVKAAGGARGSRPDLRAMPGSSGATPAARCAWA